MSTPISTNGSGHFVPNTTVSKPKTFTAGENLPAFCAVYIKAADGKAYKVDGTEAAANAYEGITDAAYTAASTATVYPPGLPLTTTGLTLVTGEVYAKQDATLVAYAGVGSGQYTLVVAIADGANSLTVVKGEVKLTP